MAEAQQPCGGHNRRKKLQNTHNAISVRYNATIAAFNALELRYADETRRENSTIKAEKKLHTLFARSPQPQKP